MLPNVARRAAAVVSALAVATACVAVSRAEITPDAARVVSRYVEATGGAASLAAERTTYTHAIVKGFGFTGSVETWSARPDRHYSRTELGPFKLAEGSDGESSWRTDPTTGRVVKLADRDLLEAKEGAWFEGERWTEPDQGGGRVSVAGHERDSLGAYTVLAIEAPGAAELKPRKLWFADATGLLARMEAAHDQSWVSTTFADWRRTAGRLRPFLSETGISSMPANKMRAEVDSLAINLSVDGVAFALPDSSGGNALRWLRTAGLAVLPFDYTARHVWLRASIDGGPEQDFLFDTGASVTVLDSAFAAAHGIATEGRMQAAGAGASGSASFARLASLTVRAPDGDGVEVRDVRVAVLSVNPMFAPYFWREMAGIVGYDFISRFVVTIDYDRGLLVLHDPKTFRYSGTEAPLSMVMNGVVPALRCTLVASPSGLARPNVDGRYEGLFRLDVGSSSTVDLHAPFAKRYALERLLRDAHPVSGAGFGGNFTNTLGRAWAMAIGPYRWPDPMVSASHASEGAFASEEFAGNIGNRILERFRVTLDYDGRRVWLEPGGRYRERDSFTRAGVLLVRENGRVEARSVLPRSPAARAGLREGDEVTSVDGRALAQWSLRELEELFERGANGRRVALGALQGGAPVTLTLTLREMLR
jgi:hypothetical protein